MTSKKIVYPKTLKDIPLWRQRQLEEDLLWFSRFSHVQRLEIMEREWEEIQAFIKKFGLKKPKKGQESKRERSKGYRTPSQSKAPLQKIKTQAKT